MRLLFCIAFLLAITGSSYAQKIQYSYDAAGNRIQRKLYVEPPCCDPADPNGPPVAGRTAKDTAKASETALKHGISVFPNPANDKISVTINEFNGNETATVALMDNAGKILKSAQQTSSQSFMDVSNLNPGAYHLRIILGKETLYYKIIKTE